MLNKLKTFFIPKTLFGRLIILPSVSVFFGFLLVTLVIGYNQYNYVKEDIKQDAKTIIKELSATLEKYLLLNDYGEVESIIRRFSLIKSIQSISLIDEKAKVLLSVQKNLQKELVLEINPGTTYKNTKEHTIMFFEENKSSYISYKPLGDTSHNKWVRLEINKDASYSKLVDLFIIANITVILLIAFLAFLIFKIIYKPMQQIKYLTSFSSTLHRTFGSSCKVESSIDEINSLSESLNQLSLELLKNQTTMRQQNQALQNFNTQLTSRVEEEVLKNKEKEIMLFNNARLVAIAEMIGNIAHQWRQPLNAIALQIQSVQFSYELGELTKEEFNEFAEDSLLQVSYLSQTIDDFRDLTKDTQKDEAFNVSQTLSKTFNLVEASLKNASIVCNLDIQEDVMCNHSNANALSQAIINILNNARDALLVKAIHKKTIDIQLKQEDSKIQITICDNAGGIPADILEKIFDPYFTTKHQSNGTGLGLYISKKIINKDLQGFLEVSNNEKGACFTIEISSFLKLN